MTVCKGTGGSGDLIFKDGWEDWWVKCPVCGTTWMGGSGDDLPEHRDIRTPHVRDMQEAEDQNADAKAAEARRLEAGRRMAQGIAGEFGSYLSMLGILNELEDFDRHLFVGGDGRLTLDAASVDELVEVLRDLLPDCWSPSVHHGYSPPDYCEWPDASLCATCQAQGKRAPRYRPPRP